MAKTILVLTGSPRAGGNSDQLAEGFIRGAQAAGKQILRFDAGRKAIGGCVGCHGCFSGQTPCVAPDDFTELAGYLQQADAIAMFTPIYWFSFPAGMKAAIDKLYSFCVAERPMGVKESICVICGEDTNMDTFDPMIRQYEKICGYLKWENKGHIVVPGVTNPGDVQNTPAIAGMEKIGTYF